jgi:hypothetical protein
LAGFLKLPERLAKGCQYNKKKAFLEFSKKAFGERRVGRDSDFF